MFIFIKFFYFFRFWKIVFEEREKTSLSIWLNAFKNLHSKTVRTDRVLYLNCDRRPNAFYCSWEIGVAIYSIGWHLSWLVCWHGDCCGFVPALGCQFFALISQCWWFLVSPCPFRTDNSLRSTVPGNTRSFTFFFEDIRKMDLCEMSKSDVFHNYYFFKKWNSFIKLDHRFYLYSLYKSYKNNHIKLKIYI